MPSIVYQTNPVTGVKYAYESISYWDKEKKAPRSKRRYIGRVDPETGEIIKGRERRKSSGESLKKEPENSQSLQEELKKKEEEIAGLRKQLEDMTARASRAEHVLQELRVLMDSLENIERYPLS